MIKKSILLLLLLVSGCLFAYPVNTEEPVVRVLLYQGDKPVTVYSPGGWHAQIDELALFKGQGLPGEKYLIKPDQGSIVILDSGSGEVVRSEQYLWLLPAKEDNPMYVKDYPYRGWLWVGNQGGRILVVNCLEISQYLAGVLPWEISQKYPEALKAQAVVSRTYALGRLKGKKAAYDVSADVNSQVYKGMRIETAASDAAIKETGDLVLFFKGNLLKHALFHSCCGGNTAGLDEAFGDEEAEYLPGVICGFDPPVADKNTKEGALPLPPQEGFCRDCPHYDWEISWTNEELEKILKPILKSGEIKLQNLEIKERSDSGRVKFLEITTDKGTFVSEKDNVRRVLLYNKEGQMSILPSSLFELEKTEQGYTAKGRGWGHGVGLCQWGAMGMAQRGENFYAILNHYYPGCEIKSYRNFVPTGKGN